MGLSTHAVVGHSPTLADALDPGRCARCLHSPSVFEDTLKEVRPCLLNESRLGGWTFQEMRPRPIGPEAQRLQAPTLGRRS